jgi:hypothetical protein
MYVWWLIVLCDIFLFDCLSSWHLSILCNSMWLLCNGYLRDVFLCSVFSCDVFLFHAFILGCLSSWLLYMWCIPRDVFLSNIISCDPFLCHILPSRWRLLTKCLSSSIYVWNLSRWHLSMTAFYVPSFYTTAFFASDFSPWCDGFIPSPSLLLLQSHRTGPQRQAVHSPGTSTAAEGRHHGKGSKIHTAVTWDVKQYHQHTFSSPPSSPH